MVAAVKPLLPPQRYATTKTLVVSVTGLVGHSTIKTSLSVQPLQLTIPQAPFRHRSTTPTQPKNSALAALLRLKPQSIMVCNTLPISSSDSPAALSPSDLHSWLLGEQEQGKSNWIGRRLCEPVGCSMSWLPLR